MDELITELTRGLAPAIWVVPTAYLLIKFFRRRVNLPNLGPVITRDSGMAAVG